MGAEAGASRDDACGGSTKTVNRDCRRGRCFRMATLLVVASFCGLARTTQGALHFLKSDPQHFDFVDQRALPPAFGGGEFTFEFWIKPDASFPVGFTDRGTLNQLSAWSNADSAPNPRGAGGSRVTFCLRVTPRMVGYISWRRRSAEPYIGNDDRVNVAIETAHRRS